MKKETLLILLLSHSVVALGASVKLAWDANPSTSVAGYKMYYGTAPRSYNSSTNVGNVTTVSIPGLLPGKRYYFSVTARNTSGIESLYSSESTSVTEASYALPFWYNFSANGSLDQSILPVYSSSPYWWLASGGRLVITNGVGSTMIGVPNVSQLFLRRKFGDVSEEVYVLKKADNLSDVANRNAWNGISLFLRYADDNTHYYVGIRADGGAVIKKKVDGIYQTLAARGAVFPGTYSSTTNPNLIPTGVWIGLRATISNDTSGNPVISLLMDEGKTGVWRQLIQIVDDPAKYGPAISGAGLCGIRSDFMDLLMDDFRVTGSGITASRSVLENIPPSMEIVGFDSNGKTTIRVTGTLGNELTLERTVDLSTWEQVFTGIIETEGSFYIRDESAPPGRCFYRVFETPSISP